MDAMEELMKFTMMTRGRSDYQKLLWRVMFRESKGGILYSSSQNQNANDCSFNGIRVNSAGHKALTAK